jgi:hypothetical protein
VTTDYTVCPRCRSEEVYLEPERSDFDDRPQVISLVCHVCQKRYRCAADDPDGHRVFWQVLAAYCPACSFHGHVVVPLGHDGKIPCPRCATLCGVFFT